MVLYELMLHLLTYLFRISELALVASIIRLLHTAMLYAFVVTQKISKSITRGVARCFVECVDCNVCGQSLTGVIFESPCGFVIFRCTTLGWWKFRSRTSKLFATLAEFSPFIILLGRPKNLPVYGV